MHRAVDLLVEERVLHEARDARVASDPELAQAAGAFVTIQGLEQEVFIRLGGGIDDAAALEAEANPTDLTAGVWRGELDERDRPLGGVFDRREVELPPRKVGPARVDLRLGPDRLSVRSVSAPTMRTSSAALKRSA